MVRFFPTNRKRREKQESQERQEGEESMESPGPVTKLTSCFPIEIWLILIERYKINPKYLVSVNRELYDSFQPMVFSALASDWYVQINQSNIYHKIRMKFLKEEGIRLELEHQQKLREIRAEHERKRSNMLREQELRKMQAEQERKRSNMLREEERKRWNMLREEERKRSNMLREQKVREMQAEQERKRVENLRHQKKLREMQAEHERKRSKMLQERELRKKNLKADMKTFCVVIVYFVLLLAFLGLVDEEYNTDDSIHSTVKILKEFQENV